MNMLGGSLLVALLVGCSGQLGDGAVGDDDLGGGHDVADDGGSPAQSSGGSPSSNDGGGGPLGGDPSNGGSPGSGGDPGTGGSGGEYVRQNLILEAGFEGSDPFDGFDMQKCCSHSVTQSDAHARTGASSFRAEVAIGDPSVSSGYRAEVLPQGISDTGEKWYGWSMYFETPASGSNWTGTNGHFVQWHPDNSSGSASLGLWSYGDNWLVGLNPEGDSSADFVDVGYPIAANTWHDVVMHVDWSGSTVQVWLDGNLEVDVDDADYGGGPGQYFKFGINRWGNGPNGSPNDDDWVIFYDDLRIGDENATYPDVAP